jgi:hypothetical protein
MRLDLFDVQKIHNGTISWQLTLFWDMTLNLVDKYPAARIAQGVTPQKTVIFTVIVLATVNFTSLYK